MASKLTESEWIDKFTVAHGRLYSYDSSIFINSTTKIEIICITHGSFWQDPYIHSKGSGCPECAHILRNQKKSKKMHLIQKKIEETNLEKYGCKRPLQNQRINLKVKMTNIERYGVTNPSQSDDIIQKIKSSLKEKYKHIRFQKNEIEKYYYDVSEFTKNSWISNFDQINPNRLQRGNEYHLDHIFSIAEGFRQKIPAKIIGHWSNLQMLPMIENSRKQDQCWKTKNELFEDYYNDERQDILHTEYTRTCVQSQQKFTKGKK